ncbi:transposase [Streptacidiphilus sp. PAMC 29251]
MSGNSNMSKRYTAEFKRDAIALVRSSPHRNVTEIARELGVSPEGLRGWVKQAKVDRGEGGSGCWSAQDLLAAAGTRREERLLKVIHGTSVRTVFGERHQRTRS